jgi:hypothetical protein
MMVTAFYIALYLYTAAWVYTGFLSSPPIVGDFRTDLAAGCRLLSKAGF